MPSFLSSGSRQASHSTANTPNVSAPVSRSNSVTSNTSHKSEPSWFTAYNGEDATRRASSATTASKDSTEKKSRSGFGSIFSTGADPKIAKQVKAHKAAEKKKKNEQMRKDIDKLIITSKHAAAVKSKLAMQNQRRGSSDSGQTTDVVGTLNSAHLTAAQQEMRFPHSGPPALHGGQRQSKKKRDTDMPALTRIVSHDEKDDEEEYWQSHREDWQQRKAPDVCMRRLTEDSNMTPPLSRSASASLVNSPTNSDDEQETILAERLQQTMEVQDVKLVGADLNGEQYNPKPRKEKNGRPGYTRDQSGRWVKQRDGGNILA